MKDDRVYLQHIKDALDDVIQYCSTDRDAFFTDCMRQDATLRKSLKALDRPLRISDHTKSLQPETPWKRIAGMRDKVIHDYFGVNLEIVWAVVQKELPRFIAIRTRRQIRSHRPTFLAYGAFQTSAAFTNGRLPRRLGRRSAQTGRPLALTSMPACSRPLGTMELMDISR